jgi:hypothetical protein
MRAVAIEDIYLDDRIPHEAYRPTFVKSLAMLPIRQLDRSERSATTAETASAGGRVPRRRHLRANRARRSHSGPGRATDAVARARPYKQAWPVEQALAEIMSLAGRQFDPMVVAAFVDLGPDALLDA